MAPLVLVVEDIVNERLAPLRAAALRLRGPDTGGLPLRLSVFAGSEASFIVA